MKIRLKQDNGNLQHKYVPTRPSTGSIALPNGSTLDFDDTKFFCTLFGGDQLTAAHGRAAAALSCNHETVSDRLEGLEPVIVDWQAR